MKGSALTWNASRISNLPELNVALFAFLLNFVWEMWQIPFFAEMPQMPHWEAVWLCTRATMGDVVIMLIAFWSVATAVRSRVWVLHPNWRQITSFVLVGVLITIGMEELSLRLGRWEYAPLMPTLPWLGTGLVPLAQWIILPPVVLWFVRRQIS